VDPFNVHFAPEPPILKPEALAAAESSEWTATKKEIAGLGRVVEMVPGKAAVKSADNAEASASRVSFTSL
jgi:U3 small nucleolar RNA-associated protein 25